MAANTEMAWYQITRAAKDGRWHFAVVLDDSVDPPAFTIVGDSGLADVFRTRPKQMPYQARSHPAGEPDLLHRPDTAVVDRVRRGAGRAARRGGDRRPDRPVSRAATEANAAAVSDPAPKPNQPDDRRGAARVRRAGPRGLSFGC